MKRIVALLMAVMMLLGLMACGKEVENIEVNGQSVAVTDFVAEHLGEYKNSEDFQAR